MKKKLLSFISLVFISYIPALAAEPIIIDKNFNSISFGNRLEYFEDKEADMVIDDFINNSVEWKKSQKEHLNFGFTESAYWFSFKIDYKLAKEKEYYLEISYPMLDYIDFHIPKKNGGFEVIKTGDQHPFHSRPVNDRNFVFLIKGIQGGNTYYIRIKSVGSMNFNITLNSTKAYLDNIVKEYPILWIYYGLMIVMVLYNLFIFFSVWDKNYLYYVLFISVWILFELSINGFSYQYLWPNSVWWASNSIILIMSLIGLSMGLFSRSYLEINKYYPTFNKIIIFSILLPGSILAILSLILSFGDLLVITTSYMFVVLVTIVYISFYTMVKGSRQARFIILAFAMFMIGGFLYLLKTFAVLPANFFTRWSLQIGSSFVVVLFSLGLADRLNTMKNELKILNKDLLDLNLNLEKKVEERTDELQSAMDELKSMNDQLIIARDAIWGEMQLAKKIQTVLLPSKPVIPGYEISAYMNPTDEVGGDYYDIINAAGRNWIVIGDVSGHGVPAGLIMMMVQTSINVTLSQNPDLPPSKILTIINETITKNIKQLGEEKYMTMTVFAIHENGRLQFSGLHQDILIYRAESEKIDIVETGGMWIGIIDDLSGILSDDSLELKKDDAILLYTDGITEAWKKDSIKEKRTIKNEMFGDKRLRNQFQDLGNRPVEEIIDEILNGLNRDYRCDDDVTLVVLRRIE